MARKQTTTRSSGGTIVSDIKESNKGLVEGIEDYLNAISLRRGTTRYIEDLKRIKIKLNLFKDNESQGSIRALIKSLDRLIDSDIRDESKQALINSKNLAEELTPK